MNDQPVAHQPSKRLVREWVVCAIAAAAARFIPVPLLDDAVKGRATRLAIHRTMRAHGRPTATPALEPIYAGIEGWTEGVGKYVRSIPRRVVLFPVRKYVALFGAVKGVPTDVMTVLLLAHTTDRALAAGRLAGPDRESVEAEAADIRRAFDAVLDELDLHVLRGALSDALSTSRGLTRSAADFAKQRFGKDDTPDDETLDPGGELAEGADNVEQALRRPEVQAQVEEFDARLDARLGPVPKHR